MNTVIGTAMYKIVEVQGNDYRNINSSPFLNTALLGPESYGLLGLGTRLKVHSGIGIPVLDVWMIKSLMMPVRDCCLYLCLKDRASMHEDISNRVILPAAEECLGQGQEADLFHVNAIDIRLTGTTPDLSWRMRYKLGRDKKSNVRGITGEADDQFILSRFTHLSLVIHSNVDPDEKVSGRLGLAYDAMDPLE